MPHYQKDIASASVVLTLAIFYYRYGYKNVSFDGLKNSQIIFYSIT